MDVSKNSGNPQIIHFNRVFHYKPSILEYPYFLETSTWNPENQWLVQMYSTLFEKLKSFFFGFFHKPFEKRNCVFFGSTRFTNRRLFLDSRMRSERQAAELASSIGTRLAGDCGAGTPRKTGLEGPGTTLTWKIAETSIGFQVDSCFYAPQRM